MNYEQAANTLLSRDSLSHTLVFLLAALALFLALGQAVKLWRELRRPRGAANLRQHVQESGERFAKGERHIEENHRDILDLKEGLRASCVANMALLNHAIHNGNTAEMEAASKGLNDYLINRK